MIWQIALIAALAMVAQDVLAVCMTQAEARNKGLLAGLLDAGMFLFALATYHLSLNALNGHSMTEKIIVIGAVTAANILGSLLGVKIGKRWIKDDENDSLEARVAALEAAVRTTTP